MMHVGWAMEHQHFRRRRRRRWASKAQRELVTWIGLLVSLWRRVYHSLGLIVVLALILFTGLGAPFTPFDRLFSWWGHW